MHAFKVLLVLALFPALAFAAAPDDDIEVDSRGAVLCIWTIYVELKAIGSLCGFVQESEFEKVLAESIDKMDKFITANSAVTQADLDRKKDAELSYLREQMEKAGPA